jgi:hypothetical protein
MEILNEKLDNDRRLWAKFVLILFSDLHVDVTLHALVFGESVLNDAVAIGESCLS